MESCAPVLIVRPQPSRGLGAFYRNLGLTMLATHARHHHLDVRLIDLTFDELAEHLTAAPAVALFSLYIDDFAEGIEIASQIKDRDPAVTTVVGGPHATLLGESVFAIADTFDLVGVGDCLPDAMPIIADAARGARPPSGQLITAPTNAARMDTLAPDYRIWPDDGRYFPVFPVELSRGCRQRCPFCTDPVLRRGIAIDPVERTMGSLRGLVADHGRIWVRFVDSSMSSLGGDLDRLLTEMITADLPVQWSAYAYPHDIDARRAEQMAAAGCRALFLGIESLAAGVRVGKHHTKRPEEVTRAIDALRDNGIFVHGNFIIGLPGETPQTAAETLDRLDQLRFDSIGGGPFFLTPGSTFERSPNKFGITILDPSWPTRQHLNFYDSDHEYFRTATLTQRQMRSLTVGFRSHVESARLGCWNLSDYAVLCWLSVGGEINDLVRLWTADEQTLTADQRRVVGVLKEKTGLTITDTAAGFVTLATTVAAQARRRAP